MNTSITTEKRRVTPYEFTCGDIEEYSRPAPGHSVEEGWRGTRSVRLWQECPSLKAYHVRLTDFTEPRAARVFWESYSSLKEARRVFDRVAHGIHDNRSNMELCRLAGLIPDGPAMRLWFFYFRGMEFKVTTPRDGQYWVAVELKIRDYCRLNAPVVPAPLSAEIKEAQDGCREASKTELAFYLISKNPNNKNL